MKTAKERFQELVKRRTEAGMKQVTVWIKADKIPDLKKAVARLNKVREHD